MVNDVSSVMHLIRNTPIAIAAFVLSEDTSDLISRMTVFVSPVSNLIQMIIEYRAGHPLGLQQDAETILWP